MNIIIDCDGNEQYVSQHTYDNLTEWEFINAGGIWVDTDRAWYAFWFGMSEAEPSLAD